MTGERKAPSPVVANARRGILISFTKGLARRSQVQSVSDAEDPDSS